MFGKNPILKKEAGDGQTLRIVAGSPWLTIQGEGPYSGHPAVFIRLHGCNLACTFCDTQFSDPADPVVTLANLLKAVNAIRGKSRVVVITGGEPMRQNITPLCAKLHQLYWDGVVIQIETAGTLWVEGIESLAEIVCSPKTPTIHPKVRAAAVAFKYVVDIEQEFDTFIPVTATQAGARPARLAPPRPGAPVYLSPMDTGNDEHNAANRRLIGDLAMRHGAIAGLQVHKFMELD